MNVQCTQFPNLYSRNNPGQINMPLKSTNQPIYSIPSMINLCKILSGHSCTSSLHLKVFSTTLVIS